MRSRTSASVRFNSTSKDRGFSFRFDAPLDMRMDPRSGRSASDILNTASEKELERILTEFGEEPKARAIARSIVMERRTTRELDDQRFFEPGPARRPRTARPRPFDPRLSGASHRHERANFRVSTQGLERLARLLRPGGRLAVIAFHCLEDRIVKNVFRYSQASPGPSSC